MSNSEVYKKLNDESLLSNESFEKIMAGRLRRLLSVYWEIKTLLYAGILMLTSGLGILVYKNIATIGHQAVLAFIALVCLACLGYCFKYKKPFSKAKVAPPTVFFDYVLLLGVISLLIFIAYLQFQYHVFGDKYALATFIPMVLLFYFAYDFDHTGIVNMAIVNLGVWMGVSVTPKQLLAAHTFNNQHLINIYTVLGLLLLAFAWLTSWYKIKVHFKFSYAQYGIYINLIATLAGYFNNYNSNSCWLWLLLFFAIAAIVFYEAYKDGSFYLVLLATLFGYIGVSSLVVRGFLLIDNSSIVWLMPYYFIISATGLVYWLTNINKKLSA